MLARIIIKEEIKIISLNICRVKLIEKKSNAQDDMDEELTTME